VLRSDRKGAEDYTIQGAGDQNGSDVNFHLWIVCPHPKTVEGVGIKEPKAFVDHNQSLPQFIQQQPSAQ